MEKSIARVLCGKKNYADAIKMFTDTSNEEHVEQIATYLFAQYEFEKCIDFAKNRLKVFTDNEILQNRILESLIANEQYNEAREFCVNYERFAEREKAIKCMIQQSAKYKMYISCRNTSNAVEAIDLLIQLNPMSIKLRETKLDILQSIGEYGAVVKMIVDEKLLETPRKTEFLFLKALSHYYLNEIYKYKNLIKEIVAEKRDYPKLSKFLNKLSEYEERKMKANIQYSKNNYKDAIDIYVNIIKECDKINSAEISEIYLRIGMCYSEMDQDLYLSKSMVSFEKSTELYPKNYEAYRKKAHVCLKMDDMNGAISNIDKALEISKNDFVSKRDSEIINKIFNLKKDEFEEKEKRRRDRAERRRLREIKRKEKIDKAKNNHYCILGLDPMNRSVSQKEIKQAQLDRLFKEHPDTTTDPEEKLLKEKLSMSINNAYAVLSDENAKARYDSSLDRYNGSDQEDNISDEEKEEEQVYSENLYSIYLFELKNKFSY